MEINISKSKNIILCFVVGIIIQCLFYLPTQKVDITCFHSDDLRLLNRIEQVTDFSSFITYIITPEFYKFRPISNLNYFIEFKVFKENYKFFIAYNILLVQIACCVALLFFKEISLSLQVLLT